MRKCFTNDSYFCSIVWLGTQDPEDEFRTLTEQRFFGEARSGSCALLLRNTQNPSPASANRQRRTPISLSLRQGRRAWHQQKTYESKRSVQSDHRPGLGRPKTRPVDPAGRWI